MKIFTFFAGGILLFTSTVIIAQTQQWNAKFNGNANKDDAITAMTADAAGNVYITGYVNNTASGLDYVTIKYNIAGVRQWMNTYNGPGNGNDVANAICIDKSGNVYVTGKSDALTGAFIDDDAATVKYNAKGQQQWVARYDGAVQRGDAGRAITADNTGNVYITGYTSERSGAKSDFNYLTVKYNTTGAQQWASVYNGPSLLPHDRNDSANAIGLDAAGNVYVTGMSNGNYSTKLDQDYLTIKYSPTGTELWTNRYDGPGQRIDEAFALVCNAQGDVCVTGVSTGAGLNDYDFTTIKYNTNGSRQWVKVFNDPLNGPDLASAITMDNFGNVYVTGDAQLHQSSNADIYTIKYNAAGVQQWATIYDGGDLDHAAAIVLDKKNNLYVTGYSTHVQSGQDMIIIKYNNNGVQQWQQQFKGTNNFAWDVSNAVAVDTLNNVYVAGYTTNGSGNTDCTVIKYTTGNTGLSNKETGVTNENTFFVYQNTPNPFRNQTTISFKIQNENKQPSDVKLWIEDASGKLLNVLLEKKLSNGAYQVKWNSQHLLPGIYYYKLRCNQLIKSGNMMIL